MVGGEGRTGEGREYKSSFIAENDISIEYITLCTLYTITYEITIQFFGLTWVGFEPMFSITAASPSLTY